MQTLLPQVWLATCPPYLLTTGQKSGPLVIQHCARRVLCCRYQLSSTKERLRVPHSGSSLFTKVNVGEHRKGSLSLTRNPKSSVPEYVFLNEVVCSWKFPQLKKKTHKPMYNSTCFCMCGTSVSVKISEHCWGRTKYYKCIRIWILPVTRLSRATSEIFTAGFLRISLLWDVTSCCLLNAEDGDNVLSKRRRWILVFTGLHDGTSQRT